MGSVCLGRRILRLSPAAGTIPQTLMGLVVILSVDAVKRLTSLRERFLRRDESGGNGGLILTVLLCSARFPLS